MLINELFEKDITEGRGTLKQMALAGSLASAGLLTIPDVARQSSSVEQVVPVNNMREQATLMALTIWGEARSHGIAGMRAVGHVILNRLHSKRHFGKSIHAVVLKRKAFSCWNPSDSNRQAMRDIGQLSKKSLEYRRWLEAKKIALELLLKKSHDPTAGALFYHTAAIQPGWAKGIDPVARISNHLFYTVDHKAVMESVDQAIVRVYHGDNIENIILHPKMFFSTDHDFAGHYGDHITAYDLNTLGFVDSLDRDFIKSILPIYDPYDDADITTVEEYMERSSDTWEMIENHVGVMGDGIIIYEGGIKNYIVYNTACLTSVI